MDYKKYQEVLQRKKVELLQLILAARGQISVETGGDEFEQITLDQVRETTAEKLRKAAKLLEKIEAALLRISQGTFGICAGEDCGATITEKRLDAVPWTTLCIHCKEPRQSETGFEPTHPQPHLQEHASTTTAATPVPRASVFDTIANNRRFVGLTYPSQLVELVSVRQRRPNKRR